MTCFKKSLHSKFTHIVFVLFASVAVVAASVGSLYLDFERGVFPSWADSIAIPLMGMPLLAIVLVLWGGLHCIFMSGNFHTSVPIWCVPFKKWNIWLGLITVVTVIIFILSLLTGFFWYVLPSFLWIYFYASLNAGRAGL